jgi:hypothetical protein
MYAPIAAFKRSLASTDGVSPKASNVSIMEAAYVGYAPRVWNGTES